MTIRLLTVGRPKQVEAVRLHDEYAERLRRLGFDYRVESIPDVRAGTRFTPAHAREREGRAISERLRSPDRRGAVVALDASGEMFDSEALARRLERWAASEVTFVIGGPSGLDRGFVEAADAVWSLSRLTFPHELARVLVAEQLYRAATMLRGIPYHK